MIRNYISSFIQTIMLQLNKKKNNYPIVLNLNTNYSKKQKRVLLCYLDLVSSNIRLETNPTHTNFSELNLIIRSLINLDCRVDVCSFYAEGIDEIINRREYDVIIGCGEVYRKATSSHVDAKKVLYLTENPYHISYQAEITRIKYFTERTGKKTKLYRSGNLYKNEDLYNSDAIICLGEPKHLEEYKKQVNHITPTGLYNDKYSFSFEKKDVKNFIVFSGNGVVHKGIDLLVEVFKNHEDWNLFICGNGVEEQFKRLHVKYKYPNIQYLGYVDVSSDLFIKLVDESVYCLLPSCSEASATSLLTCMRHGVIPITTHSNGMDQYSDYCLFFEDYHIEAIERTIQDAMGLEMSLLATISIDVFRFANEEFSLKRFEKDINRILGEIVDGKNK